MGYKFIIKFYKFMFRYKRMIYNAEITMDDNIKLVYKNIVCQKYLY